MGVIIDSSVAIHVERQGQTAEQLIERVIFLTGDQGAALSAVGLTELVFGIHRAHTETQRRVRQGFIDDLIRDLTVYPYTASTANLAGRINAEQQTIGIVIPFADLLIGATALSLGFSVITANPRHFRLIPGLTVIEF